MTRAQILILAILAITVCIVLGIAAVMIRPLLEPQPSIAEQPAPIDSPGSAPTATWAPIPTSTFTPTPMDTRIPTPTYTRVVSDTVTPTPSPIPTITPTPGNTLTPTRRRSSGSGGGPHPTPAPTSRYPFKIVEGPLEYETDNYIFVIFARVTSGDVLLPDYRLVGTHTPTGVSLESEPSCDYLCDASGPKREKYLIQEGNLAFEAFFYDTGTWSLMLIDPQGQQASEVLEIDIDIEDRKWFYYRFSR